MSVADHHWLESFDVGGHGFYFAALGKESLASFILEVAGLQFAGTERIGYFRSIFFWAASDPTYCVMV